MTPVNTDKLEPAVYRLSTRAIMNCVFLFFLCCFICLGYIVLHQKEYINGDDGKEGFSYIVTDHQKIRQPQAAPAIPDYRGKIVNIEDVEISTENSKNAAPGIEETDAEKLWKQFSKFKSTKATEKVPMAKRHLRS
jgi:hypothetical protein